MMMRKCHLNTCPVGIATQDPELRKRFHGEPKHVVNYFFFVAEEVREIMASLGIRKFEDLVGCSDLLRQKKMHPAKCAHLDLSRVLYQPEVDDPNKRRQSVKQNHGLEKELDYQLLDLCRNAIEKKEKVSFISPIKNIHRTVGTKISSEIIRRWGAEGLPEDTLHIQLTGTAGQSFGAFLANGVTLDLVGEANDYVGKGLSGGRIIVRCPTDFRGRGDENIIAGNTVLYGATSGEAFFNGVTGERFAVRLSGATAVSEGCGDHGCEYMTGGRVAVLGGTGKNFAAGMSGGVAYVLDMENDLYTRVNKEMVHIEHVTTKMDVGELKSMIEEHVANTNSELGKKILDNFTEYLPKFKKIIPIDYERMLTTILQMEEQGMSSEQAKTEAFYAIKEGR